MSQAICSCFIRVLDIARAGPRVAEAGSGVGMPDFAIEDGCRGVVCGVDEAGRGPLAGPVVAAAVIIDRGCFTAELAETLDDSKLLRRDVREACYRALRHCAWIGVGAASV